MLQFRFELLLPFTGGGVFVLRLSEINLGLDGILHVVSRLYCNCEWALSGLTNVPLFLVQLHAPSAPFRDFLYIFDRLASPASSY